MNRVPAGVTEVEYKRAFARLEQGSARGPRELKSDRSLVDAAALQLDMSRRYNLGGTGPRNNSRGVTVPKRAAKQVSRGTNDAKQQQAGAAAGAPNAGPWSSSSSSSSSAAAPKNPTDNYVFCMSCRAGNLSTETVCGECGFFLEGPMRPAAPTLAQRRGLGQAPAQMDAPVVRSEWEVIEARLVTRKDANCPICMEGFNQGYEVLLSCSHIFHRSCLESFEAFMGSREARNCPICRKSNYQKKITKCGSAAWEESKAALLQALYRGHLQRKRFYDAHFHKDYSYMPAAHGGGKLGVGLLRRRYLSQELTYLDNARKKEVDRVVSGIDATLTENQQLDALFDQMLRNRQTYHDVTGTSETETEAMASDERRDTTLADGARDEGRYWSDRDGGDDDDGDDAKDGSGGKEGEVKYTIREEEWPAVVAMACQRGLGTCSICLCNNKGLRGLSLLSCSHLFHTTCLLSFTRFAQDRKQRSGCPLCRSPFCTKKVSTNFEILGS